MPLEKTGTCNSCGYQKIHCICHNQNQHGTMYRRNTSGEIAKYQHYQNYQDTNNDQYAETARINRHSDEQKFMEELWPVNGENCATYLARTSIASTELIKHAMHKHIYGGRKPWPSHTSTRYCPVCTLCQLVNTLTDILIALSEIQDISKLTLYIQLEANNPLNTKISFKSFKISDHLSNS